MKRPTGIGPGQGQWARPMRGALLPALVLCGLLLAGCGAPEYDPSLLKQAAALGEGQQWDAARPLIKQHLLRYPNDAIGHYYYGLSYLHLHDPQLTLAEGELLTAQALLSQDDSPTEAAAGMEYFTFKGVLHQKTALVYMRAFREALRLNAPLEYGHELLLKAAAQVDLGLKSNPKSHALKEYRDFLQETLQGAPLGMPEVMTRKPGDGSSI